MVSARPSPPRPAAPAARARILDVARTHLFAYGFSVLTMDDLARELGMSKKTLYVHFPSKDAIAGAILDDIGRSIRTQLDTALAHPQLTFAQKLCRVIDVVGAVLSKVSPSTLRDLQRYAPHLYQKIEEVRQKNVPYVIGRLIRTGLAEGKVRRGIDPAFAAEFWLQAIRGLVQPAVLDRTQLTPRQTLEKALHLFFHGLLTAAGRHDYEKHLASCHQHAAV
ncbi:MAG TPA: TetR/AcrR family transcriptional regulator [Opitutaceae bacterium]|nr:TetR/AcrR family transcriptional regulator [Opitutaceae bacterium]